MKLTTLWRSESRAPNGEPYLSVHQLGHYYYSQRAGTNSVAFILIDKKTNRVGLINIYHGPTPTIRNCAFTGSLDNPELDIVGHVIEEVEEESGYKVTNEDISYFGTYEVGTQTNELVHLYLVYVDEGYAGEKNPDGTHEAEAETVWMPAMEATLCRDWKAVLMAKFIENLPLKSEFTPNVGITP